MIKMQKRCKESKFWQKAAFWILCTLKFKSFQTIRFDTISRIRTFFQPKPKIVEPCRTILEPWRTIVELCRTILEPCRTILELCRTVFRTMKSYSRTVVELFKIKPTTVTLDLFIARTYKVLKCKFFLLISEKKNTHTHHFEEHTNWLEEKVDGRWNLTKKKIRLNTHWVLSCQ